MNSEHIKSMKCVAMIFVLVLFAVVSTVRAEKPSIELLLNGYCRPGKWMPVMVSGSVTLSMGGMPTVVEPPTIGAWRIVPVLATLEPRTLSGDINEIALRAPAENERLVGFFNQSHEGIETIFDRATVIPIQLNAIDFSVASPMVWEALDAIVIDRATIDRMTDIQRGEWLAQGTALAVTSKDRPDDRWPWKLLNSGLWVLRLSPDGLESSASGGLAERQPFIVPPGRGSVIRRQVVLVAAAFSIVSLGLAIFTPSRWRAVALVIFSIVACVAIAAWRKSLPATAETNRQTLHQQGDFTRTENWRFVLIIDSGKIELPLNDSPGDWRPVISPEEINRTKMALHVTETNQLSLICDPAAHNVIPLLNSFVEPRLK